MVNNKKKIAVFTGTRAEYGLMYWIIKALNEAPNVELQLMVGGMHLSNEFGYTVSHIEADGFPIMEKLEFLLSSDSTAGVAKSMGLALMSAAEAFARNEPDLLVVLGDRFEAMAVAQAAMVARVPIAHLHGGETTEGLIDEAVRHSITKMSHLHFTSTEQYRDRVIQLGENPRNVFNTGAPGIDSIVRLPLMTRDELDSELCLAPGRPFFVVTYHPVTLIEGGASQALENLLIVMDEYPDHQMVVSYPNADMDGRHLIEILERYRDSNPDRVLLVESLGQLRYLSALKHCTAVIGNSSSGLIEAPTFRIPTLNIGDRQKGRIFGETVVSCSESANSIRKAMEKILSTEFREKIQRAENPYGNGDASDKIVNALLSYPLNNILEKKFYDLNSKI
ncbi:UDP-N-acetylglucosamine 2-epimerase [Neptuniibacter halophilus]|uniref:UDP-N-acetylglucosamine 2-epimerase n=1 Tax=Neptuniibacter halophilus TaxID=651666 RepID=UPI0025739961|nr:UDP-N-acetylglucosamine 2-epimerase [Neptuniibacter halophilus]